MNQNIENIVKSLDNIDRKLEEDIKIWINHIVTIDNSLNYFYDMFTKNIKPQITDHYVYWLSESEKLTDIKYIGKTNNYFIRFFQHLNLTSLSNSKKNEWIFNMYKENKPIYMIILWKIEKENINILEVEIIKEFEKNRNQNLLNRIKYENNGIYIWKKLYLSLMKKEFTIEKTIIQEKCWDSKSAFIETNSENIEEFKRIYNSDSFRKFTRWFFKIYAKTSGMEDWYKKITMENLVKEFDLWARSENYWLFQDFLLTMIHLRGNNNWEPFVPFEIKFWTDKLNGNKKIIFVKINNKWSWNNFYYLTDNAHKMGLFTSKNKKFELIDKIFSWTHEFWNYKISYNSIKEYLWLYSEKKDKVKSKVKMFIKESKQNWLFKEVVIEKETYIFYQRNKTI